jgi:YegS/Rv2252/BmrU family lipid kinase
MTAKEPTTKQQITFIINPASGTNRNHSRDFTELVEKHLDRSLFEWNLINTNEAGQAITFSKEASEQGKDIVVAVGGDGTVNEVARGLVGSDVKLGIIPCGSGNGLARFLGIPVDVAQAINILNSGKSSSIDTVSINENLFLSIAGVGFDALVADKFAQAHRRGFLSYFRIATSEYLFYKPRKYFLDIDGQVIKRRALFISFANSDQFGYNTTIAPTADISDGMIDVCIVKKIPLFKAPWTAHMLLAKKIDQSNYVEIIKAKYVNLRRRKNEVINIDGEPVLLTRDLVIRVNPLAQKVIVP